MNKKVLAQINNVCTELEALGMNKEAAKMTDIMAKIANKIGSDRKPYDRAYIKKVSGIIVIIFNKNNSNKDRPPVYKNPRTGENFQDVEEALQVARRNAYEVEDLTNRDKLKWANL